MKRSLFLAALLLCAPALAHAQVEAEELVPRLTLSAYTGLRAPFGGGLASVFVPSGELVTFAAMLPEGENDRSE